MCDELFQSKLDLRRHRKYACGAVGAALYGDLGDELKPEGLGGGDGQAHECKDCERMFPSKYRCARPQGPAGTAGSVGLGAQGALSTARSALSLQHGLPRDRHPGPLT